MRTLGRILIALPLLILLPLLIAIPVLAFALEDLFFRVFGKKRASPDRTVSGKKVSVVIPNWNGRDLLDKYLPSVIAAGPDEIVVVDNGSTDGSAEFVRSTFPQVHLVAFPENLGFGGGSNAGFRAARNEIVVLLNSDMRVDRDFLKPLVDAFTDEKVFAVACQIFFSDPRKVREETGLTQAAWEGGRLRVRHRIDDAITEPYPCFYGGGGSCAFDRRKFLELGGFDELLKPFYLEDTDLGYMAWKQGWKVLYAPKSIVFHEHRGTIGKKFSQDYINSILHKNFVLFAWKNIHDWRMFGSHFVFAFADSLLSAVFGNSPERTNAQGLVRACLQLPGALRSRWNARSLAVVSDVEAFRRPLGGYFRDRFQELTQDPDKLNVLFVSPYPICPPVHGGGVFMYQTCRELAQISRLHLITLLDFPQERQAHEELVELCASAEFLLRMKGSFHTFTSISPHAIAEFHNQDLAWLIHRQIYTKQIDVLQLEYLPLAQYAGEFRQIPSILFEHDIYFQSIGRQLSNMPGALRRWKARYEYLRGMRYELRVLPHMDRIQVCSKANREFLESFRPDLRNRIDDNLRAGIDTRHYDFHTDGREPGTMLFLGSFRHIPNKEALEWFIRNVLPLVLQERPDAKLVVIGSDPPPRHSLPNSEAIELIGFVDDVLAPLRQYSVFVCPILSGSGVRVKLLEAFAAGIPTVSTHIGAEGLAEQDGEICRLTDDPVQFARAILELLANPGEAAILAERARDFVVNERDMRTMTRKLEKNYRAAVSQRRTATVTVSQQASDSHPSSVDR